MRKQGKIKSISVTEVSKGMQVIFENKICKIISIDNKNQRCKLNHPIFNHQYPAFFKELKTLVVEYENETEIDFTYTKLTTKQLPLKYSQWQSALDNNEVDSDKTVEFETKNIINTELNNNKILVPILAKIIPTKKKLYTEEEVKKILWFHYVDLAYEENEENKLKIHQQFVKENLK